MEGYGLRLNKRIGEPEGTKEENKAIGFLIFSHLFARNPLSYPPFTPFTLVQHPVPDSLRAYCFVESAMDDFKLLRPAELDEVHSVAGNANGQLGI